MPYYIPPYHIFIDYGATINRYSKDVTNGRIYKWLEDVRYWISWINVRPLLQIKKVQISREITALTERG